MKTYRLELNLGHTCLNTSTPNLTTPPSYDAPEGTPHHHRPV
jgi:hypothetical protein